MPAVWCGQNGDGLGQTDCFCNRRVGGLDRNCRSPRSLAPVRGGGIVAAMKPTFIALLAWCLCMMGCATLNDVGRHLRGADSQEGQSADKGINQTSKVKVGSSIWEFETGDGLDSTPAIGSDGTV